MEPDLEKHAHILAHFKNVCPLLHMSHLEYIVSEQAKVRLKPTWSGGSGSARLFNAIPSAPCRLVPALHVCVQTNEVTGDLTLILGLCPLSTSK